MLFIDKNGGVNINHTILLENWLTGNGNKLPDDIAIAIGNDHKFYEELSKVKTSVKPKIVNGELLGYEEVIPEYDLSQQTIMQASGNLRKTQAELLDKFEHMLPKLMELTGESPKEIKRICELVEQRDEWRANIAEVSGGDTNNVATI